MRHAPGVAAQGLELLQAPGVQGVGDGGAHAGMILVVAGALELVRRAIEQEAALGVEGDAAHAERDLDRVACDTVHTQLGQQPVQDRGLGRPQLRRVEGQRVLHRGRIAGRRLRCRQLRLGDHAPVVGQDLQHQHAGLGLVARVVQRRLHRAGGLPRPGCGPHHESRRQERAAGRSCAARHGGRSRRLRRTSPRPGWRPRAPRSHCERRSRPHR